MNTTPKSYVRMRIGIVSVFFLILMGIIGGRVVSLLLYKGEWLSEKAANQYERSYTSKGKRGSIYDVRHRELAVSISVTSVAAFPSKMKNPKADAKKLAKALSLNAGKLLKTIDSGRSFVWVKRKVSPRETAAVNSLKLKGVDFIDETSRFYPSMTLAAQTIGFSGIDGRGLEGIEFYYDRYLKEDTAELTFLKDAIGRRFESKSIHNRNFSGSDLVLTIDQTIQHITEKVLAETVERYEARSGMVVVMEPRSGAILAMAHMPEFNPNDYGKYNRFAWRNRTITDPFEPGSTMKVFSAAAAIESGGCTRNTIFFCENGEYRIGKDTVHDTHPKGWLSLENIIKYSSNIGAVKVSESIGAQTLYETLRDFGFGEKTGIDCPGETAGTLTPYRKWSKIDAGAIAFGQGISVSAVQLTSAVATIANDGVRMQPYVVHAIQDNNGRVVKSFAPKRINRAVSVETARAIRRMMMEVTREGGTGVNADLDHYAVAGKTGTAQKIDKSGTYAAKKFVSSFVGFTPAENPAVVILVSIDEPKGAHYASVVAAPAFKEIAREVLVYLNISPMKKINTVTLSREGRSPG